MSGRQHWVVTLSGRRPLAAVREDLKAAGFSIEEAMEAIGVVTGTCDASSVSRIRQIDGVEDVSPDRQVDIGPPDSPSTW